MLGVVQSIAPIFVVIVIGQLLYRTEFVAIEFWKGIERLVHYVLFPALLVKALCESGNQGSLARASIATAVALIACTTLLAAVLMAVARRIGKTPAAFTSVFQGAIRYNSYIFLAVANALWGDQGTQVAAAVIAYMVMVTNALAVYVLSRYVSEDGRMNWSRIIRSFLANPIIASSAVGIALGLAGADLSVAGLDQLLSLLGHAAFGLSLLAVGASLRVGEFWLAWQPIAIATMLKLLVFPALVALVARAAGGDGISWRIAVLYAAVPCASNSYILAAQMGGDARLMAAIVTVSTASAIVTMPVVLSIL